MRHTLRARALAGALCVFLMQAAFASHATETPPPAQTTTTTTTTTNTPPPAAPAPQMSMKEAMQKLGLVAFPAKGQTPEQQEADELACLEWSAEQAGVKPNSQKDVQAAGKQAAAHVDSVAKGAAVKGAAKGAAVGAIIGSISGDAGAGAAYGAAGGAVVGRRAKKQATAQAQAAGEKS